ncbi:MAG: transcription termination factor Rho, partial [Coriobacteriaceae bacterium]|nr:transcription termination factor Rho [Coriobacteriaceae bacterium]
MNTENAPAEVEAPAAASARAGAEAPAKRVVKAAEKAAAKADAAEAEAVKAAAASEKAVADAAPAQAPAEDAKPVKRRPGRPRKSEAARAAQAAESSQDAPSSDAAQAKVDEGASEPQVAAPAKRRGRPRKSAQAAAEAEAAVAVESAEIMQARALAQISQASVVRRERRRAERAEKMLTGGSSEGAAPAKDATFDPVADKPLMVDPALRPHARGRKPKAYVEAEKAVAEALAAQQAAYMAEREKAAHAGEKAEDGAAAQVEGAGASAAERAAESVSESEAAVAPVRDSRPGRASRAKKAAADAPRGKRRSKAGVDEDAPAPAAPADASASEGASAESSSAADASAPESPAVDAEPREGKQARRSHQSRRDNDRADRPDRADRADRKNGKADERRERRERQKEMRKQRNNRAMPTEPSLSKDELAAMKVAELREKARELDMDPTGIKKAELVEAVYAAAARAEGFRDIEGILDMDNQGYGYIRAHGYMPSRDDAFVSAQFIRGAGLRAGDYICGTLRPMRPQDKLPGLAKLTSVNGMDPDQVKKRPKFSDLTPIYPNEPLKMEHGKDSITGRAIDIVSPIGKGQRGLIVSPPKAGKTTILKKICQSIAVNNPEVHLICLLVDERPEEVTDMQRSIKGDVVASTFDMPADNHTRVSELVIERAKRIVEMGGDVVVVLDSITRLARAYNIAAPASGRILSGGVDSAALYPPKRFLGAARNIENGGSLTILASALIETGSKMDEVIFEEFKGTGNM